MAVGLNPFSFPRPSCCGDCLATTDVHENQRCRESCLAYSFQIRAIRSDRSTRPASPSLLAHGCGPLKPWASELLQFDRLRAEGYLRPEPIKALWEQHQSGRYDHSARLWTVLMWQSWLENGDDPKAF